MPAMPARNVEDAEVPSLGMCASVGAQLDSNRDSPHEGATPHTSEEHTCEMLRWAGLEALGLEMTQ